MKVCAAPAVATYLTHMRNWILFLIAVGVRAGPLYHLGIPWDAAKAAATAALPLAFYIFGMEHKSIWSGRSKMEMYFFFQLCLFPKENITMEGSWGSQLKKQNTELLKKLDCSRIQKVRGVKPKTSPQLICIKCVPQPPAEEPDQHLLRTEKVSY